MSVKKYRDLQIWQKGVKLVDEIYDITAQMPKEEVYGLTSQMRRSAISIPSNIAEGGARQGTKELIHFLNIAKGSLAELETQLIIAERRKFITRNELERLLLTTDTLDNMIFGLMNSLRKKISA